jgi:CheY-like chemotaxis protein
MLHEQANWAAHLLDGIVVRAQQGRGAAVQAGRSLTGKAQGLREERMTTVLIADVDKNLGLVLKQELEDEGFLVRLAREARPANAEDARCSGCDVVILGMLVPSLDVFNRLRLLKQVNAGAEIIFFAEQLPQDETAALLDAGADRCFGRHEIAGLKRHLAGRYPAAKTGLQP